MLTGLLQRLQRLVLSIDHHHHQQNPGGASSGLQYRMWNVMSRCDAGKYHCGGSGSSYTSEEQSKYNKNLNVVRCSSCFFIQDLGSLVVRTADSWLDNTFNQPITR